MPSNLTSLVSDQISEEESESGVGNYVTIFTHYTDTLNLCIQNITLVQYEHSMLKLHTYMYLIV